MQQTIRRPIISVIRLSIMMLTLFAFSSQAASYLPNLTAENAGKKIAVVSISANNFGGSIQGWGDANATELMTSRLNEMLTFAEQTFVVLPVKLSSRCNHHTTCRQQKWDEQADRQVETGQPAKVAIPSALQHRIRQ